MKIHNEKSRNAFLSAGVQILLVLMFFSIPVLQVFASGGKPEPAAMTQEPGESAMPNPEAAVSPEGTRIAVLAGGCFWGIEGIYERLEGVVDVISGYSGGEASTARYNLVGTGTTGHAESVRIIYDPAKISYKTLLEVFFSVAHDPTQLNYQGPDYGPQYRSAIFYADEEQKREAREYIQNLTAKKVFKDPVVTKITPLEAFYPAEDYHQDFIRKNPSQSYVVYHDLPKIRNLERMYPNLLAEE